MDRLGDTSGLPDEVIEQLTQKAQKQIADERNKLTPMMDYVNFIDEEPHIHLMEVDIGSGLGGVPSEIKTQQPEIIMVNPSNLFIDRRYQRELTGEGRKNIRQIIENFDWMNFQPILISPIEEDDGEVYYTIIDGQHRALAALNHPDITDIPAAIVNIHPKRQAHVFAEINSKIIKVSELEIFWARYFSGRDEKAKEIFKCIDRAGLFISRRVPTSSEIEDFEDPECEFRKNVWQLGFVKKSLHNQNTFSTSLALRFISLWQSDEPKALNSLAVVSFTKFFNRLNIKEFDDLIPVRMEKDFSYSDAWNEYTLRKYTKHEQISFERVLDENIERYWPENV